MLIGCHYTNVAAKFKYFNSSQSVALQILVNALARDKVKCCPVAGFSSNKRFSTLSLYIDVVWNRVAFGEGTVRLITMA